MRAINVMLSLVVSVILGVAVLEIGLCLLGMGPQSTINQFDPVTGWSKTPNAKGERKTREFDVHYDINALGLRDDPMTSPAKPAGKFRVLMLGDSFVLGYTVERRDLFVDLLRNWWKAEGREVDVINAGTEGWSTDQEVAWFEAHGPEFQPDAVVIFPYENDLYWDGQDHYRRFPKPRYTDFGNRLQERLDLRNPGPKPWFEHTALGSMWSAMMDPPERWQLEGRWIEKEYGAYMTTPPEHMVDALARTKGAFIALKAACKKLGEEHGGKSLPLYVVPIPEKVAIEAKAKEAFGLALHPKTLPEALKFWRKPMPLDPALWSADKPVDTFLTIARELNLPALDARVALREAAANNTHLYYETDWHLNPHGNRVFARFLHDQFDRAGLFPAAFAATKQADMPVEETPFPRWPFVYLGLWLVLSTLYAITYRDEPRWKAALGVAVMLGLVFTIAIGGGTLIHMLPQQWSSLIFVLVLTVILSFVVIKLGRRLTTIGELFTSFTRRGHWYLMPLVVVLLSIGSLLVVAASSPLIAPFIYTLF